MTRIYYKNGDILEINRITYMIFFDFGAFLNDYRKLGEIERIEFS